MQYSETNKPGLADPSWYEWSVGQQYIIDMLNDDNKIKSVELQANVALGLPHMCKMSLTLQWQPG